MNVIEHHARYYIKVEDFTIAYENNNIFKPIEFTIESGDCVVFRGDNGTGKSSVIKAILGTEVP
jgi:lincosamide and streptogramin A transport system ATP-binding/permease protein